MNTADAIYIGTSPATRVYSGETQVWPAQMIEYTRFNPERKSSDITLYDEELQADSNAPTGGASVLSVDGKITGRYYFEIQPNQLYTDNSGFLTGVMVGDVSYTQYTGASNDSYAIASTSAGSATWTVGVATNSDAEGGSDVNHYHRIAVDVGTGEVWLAASNRSSGAWIGGGDPATGTSPTYTFTPDTTRKYISASPRRGDAVNVSDRNKLVLKVDPSEWSDSAPSGFSGWITNVVPSVAVFFHPSPDITSAVPSASKMGVDGALDVVWHGRVNWDEQDDSASFYPWSLDNGENSLQYAASGTNGTFTLTIKGADAVTASMIETSMSAAHRAKNGQLMTVRSWYDPVSNLCGMRMGVNGVYQWDAIGATSANTLVLPPATAWVGAQNGGAPYSGVSQDTFISYNRGVSKTMSFAGCVIGDSTIASYSSASGVNVASLIREVEWNESKLIRSLALGGDTIAGQNAKWNSFAEKSGLEWVMVQIGLNDIDPDTPTATSISLLQDLIDDVVATKPADCEVIVGQMIPCYARMITRYGNSAPDAYVKWLAMNEAIAGEGSTPITGVDARVTSHVPLLDNGTGYLRTEYDSGDGIHPNNDGRQIIADAWVDVFDLLGISLNG